MKKSIPLDIWPSIDPDKADHKDFLEPPDEPKPQDVNPAKTTYVALSPTEKHTFENLMKFWDFSLKRYEKQQKGLEAARALIMSRVSDSKNGLLEGDQTPREWLAVLKQATEASEGFIQQQTVDKYYAVFKRSPSIATINKWLSAWELTMMEANKQRIPQVHAGQWLRDLALAIKPLSDTLYVMFIQDSTDKAKYDSKQYLKTSVKIREVIEAARGGFKGRVVRGAAFAAQFDGEQVTDDDKEDDKKKSRKRAGTVSALPNAEKKLRRTCKACGGIMHNLTRCYYVFPELRPERFRPIKKLEKKVAKALEDNEELAEEVDKIRKELEAKTDKGGKKD